MLSILVVIDSMKLGGAQTYVIKLIELLIKNKNKVILCTDEGEFISRIHPNTPINILPLGGKNVFKIIRSIYLLRKVLLDSRVDIIHCNALIPNIICKIAVLLSGNKIKIVSTIHKIWEIDTSSIKKIFIPFIYPIIGFCNDKIILITEYSFVLFKKNIHESKLRLVYNGIETMMGKSLKLSESRCDYLYDLVFVGRLVSVKRIDLLLEVIAYLKNDFNIKCCLVGEGNLKDKLQILSKKLNIEDNVIFIGYRSNIDEILKKSKVFVVTSECEGISYSMLEALRCEMPIIGFDVPGVNEVIYNDINGYLIPFNSVVEYANSLQKILQNDNLFERLQRGSRILLNDKFSVGNMYKNIYNIYKSVIE
jgi:glycosyltransferase involved in cell wall biosynthesis